MSETPRSTDDFPDLPGYLSIKQAAKLLGVAKFTIFHNIYERRLYRCVYKFGDERAMLALLESEFRAVHADRLNGVPKPTSLVTRQREWRSRVVAWARETGWDKTFINRTGMVPRVLHADYLAAHPEDPRPE